jgi:hypothetical protein
MQEGGGVLERAFNVIKTLNVTNILIFALIVVIGIPAYFAYRFIADEDFRREFMSTAIILERYPPCIVLEGHKYGGIKRHSVLVVYGFEGRFEKLIGLRSPEPMSFDEIQEMCKRAAALGERLKEGIAEDKLKEKGK